MGRRVVVTGLGVVSPFGLGIDAFWNGLTTGAAAFSPSPDLATAGVAVVGAVKDLSAAAYLRNPRHARVLNRTFELLVIAGALAAEDAGLSARPIRPGRLGIVIGSGPINQHTGDLVAAARQATTDGAVDPARFARAALAMHPLRRIRQLPNIGAALLSIEHRAMGPGATLVDGHAAGLQAIGHGLAMILDGKVDAVLCGGADARLTPVELRALALRSPLCASADPNRGCRPFDRDRDGITPGEGAGVVLLEAERSAGDRGATPYAQLVSSGAAAGPGSCADAIRKALTGGGVRAPDVVVAHGDGGVASDRAEAGALRPVAPAHVTSLQAAVGHTMSACGALNLIAGCLVLARDRIPPIRSLESPEAALPFVLHPIAGRFSSVLVNALEHSRAATSALLTRP